MSAKDKKKVQFLTTYKAHADLKIRLQYDDLRLREFFNAVIDGYNNSNEDLLKFVEELKEKKQAAKSLRQKIYKSQKAASSIKKQFALDEGEIEDIFDIIAKENPEL